MSDTNQTAKPKKPSSVCEAFADLANEAAEKWDGQSTFDLTELIRLKFGQSTNQFYGEIFETLRNAWPDTAARMMQPFFPSIPDAVAVEEPAKENPIVQPVVKEIDHGGPAFPIPEGDETTAWHGMMLRDYFAAQAMTILAAQLHLDKNFMNARPNSELAKTLYAFADAMIEARKT